MTTPARLGIIIPTLNEEDALPHILTDLACLTAPHCVVVADGGSTDRTRGLAIEAGCTVVDAPRGRGRQMNAGAGAIETPWLLFLHADVRVPAATVRALEAWMAEPPAEAAGVFGFRLDARGPWWWAIEAGQRVRESLTGLSYGDQGLLISRERFERAGGFPELPVMEDVEMVRRLRLTGGVDRIPAPVVSSPRRYQEEGPFRAWLRNALLITLYGAGVSPDRLARLYPARNGSVPVTAGRRTLLVFAKDPVPGKVKTRLATALGNERAAAVYRQLGRGVTDSVRGGRYRTVVAFDPPPAEAAIRDWLGSEKLGFTPQHSGDLGARLDCAFRQAFMEAEAVCAIGTDAPGVDQSVVETAFTELERPGGADVVIGPALDGGYYLLGLRRPTAALFQGIPWSTDRVLERTLERVRATGLTAALLEPLADVDRVEDLPAGFL